MKIFDLIKNVENGEEKNSADDRQWSFSSTESIYVINEGSAFIGDQYLISNLRPILINHISFYLFLKILLKLRMSSLFSKKFIYHDFGCLLPIPIDPG